jgi:hypothetical protein
MDRKITAHHVLPKQVIRQYVRGLRLPSVEAIPLSKRLLSDTRNRLWLCDGPLSCHAQFENHRLMITREQIPASAFVFATELSDSLVSWLEKRYPDPQQEAA